LPDSLACPPPLPALERIRRARTIAHVPDAPVPVTRAWALEACLIDVEHAQHEFWALAHRFHVAHAFDRFLVPTCHLATAHPHERQAGVVLNWLSHLQAEEHEIGRSIALGQLRTNRAFMRAALARRRRLKRGWAMVLARYLALRRSAAGRMPGSGNGPARP
jgi:hypothetical protein